MNDIVEFKRMKFFTGFFTTAEDWNAGQMYHLEKRRLHNRTMHTPGIVRGEKDELQVIATGGFDLEIRPGVVLNGLGEEIYVSQPQELSIDQGLSGTVYIAIQFVERDSDYVENEQEPLYSNYTRIRETFKIKALSSLPDNLTRMELARISLKPDMGEITNADIDRSHVLWAGAVGVVLPQLDPGIKGEIQAEMESARETFADLAAKFLVPSLSDVRYAALTIDMLTRSENLQTDQVREVLSVLAEVEEDAGQEIGARYGGVAAHTEFKEYQNMVGALLQALAGSTTSIVDLLGAQHAVTSAAKDLADIVLTPLAQTGEDQSVATARDEATVLLDAGESKSILDIVKYRWNKAG